MKQYIVDAFTAVPFAGNPAAVCVIDHWPSEEAMMKLAMENNLSETAFIVKEPAGYHLRWFTPETEVELCGHATLASSYVILNYIEPDAQQVEFNTMSGKLTIRRVDGRYQMDFPTYELTEIPVTDAMEAAFGVRPIKAILGLDLICVFEDASMVRNMTPEQNLLAQLPGRIQNATAEGSVVEDSVAEGNVVTAGTVEVSADCVSRSFCPKLGIPEDPVCGSAHCQIADHWASELGLASITAYQASRRGGYLYCSPQGNGRISISGDAAIVGISEILAEL